MPINKVLLKNKWFSIVEDKPSYFYLKKRPTVFIVPRDENGFIYFVKEYRQPIKRTIIQLPAGMVEKESNIKSAKRELFEETGLISAKWTFLGSFFVAPGHEDSKIFTYLADNVSKNENKKFSKEKNISLVLKLSQNEMEKMIINNKITCGITIAALNFYFLNQTLKH